MKILNFLKINFNKNVNEVLRLAYKCGNAVTFLDKLGKSLVLRNKNILAKYCTTKFYIHYIMGPEL